MSANWLKNILRLLSEFTIESIQFENPFNQNTASIPAPKSKIHLSVCSCKTKYETLRFKSKKKTAQICANAMNLFSISGSQKS